MADTKRSDDREPGQIRAMEIKLDPLNNADGSTTFKFGRTETMAGVYGPREAKIHQRSSEESIVTVHIAASRGDRDAGRANEAFLRQTLEAVVMRDRNPLCAIEVSCQTMLDEGSALAANVNSAIMALVSAAVPLRAVAAGVACAVMPDGAIIVDPSKSEEVEAQAVLTFVFEGPAETPAPKRKLIAVESTGCVSEEQLEAAMEACAAAVEHVINFSRMGVEQQVQKRQKIHSS
ncbi:ribosomal protein S5 domain 2-type protein [Baffinella frigidus]|nr:ribosomal protein S5 domain 2-type protein [Cryptophyta sp. CCMP2293]